MTSRPTLFRAALALAVISQLAATSNARADGSHDEAFAEVAAITTFAPAGGSVGGQASTSSPARGSASGTSYDYELPERVVGGNAFSVLLPFQIGAIGYLPKARLGLAYDRQLVKGHWLWIGASFLGDYGNFQNFRMRDSSGNRRCGYENAGGDRPPDRCGNNSVLGFDVALGYVHKWYIKDKPWLVPFLRAGLGFGWWHYSVGEDLRQQKRKSTFHMSVRPSGGIRFFATGDFGIGFELEVPIGFNLHDQRLEGASSRAGFVLGFATLLGLEYRF